MNRASVLVRRTEGAIIGLNITIPANATSYNDSGLPSGKKYFYNIYARNTVGDSAWSNTVNETTNTGLDPILPGLIPGWHDPGLLIPLASAPSAPTGLTAEADSTEISLTWTDVSNETGYKIERKTEGGAYAEVGSVGANVTTFSNIGLDPTTKYYYQVKAYNGIGSSGYSNEANATTGEAAPTVAVPGAPTGLEAAALSGTEVSLTWEDNSDNETGFKIECKTEGGDYVEIGEIGPDVTACTHPGLTQGTKYYYRVKAFNAGGESPYSNVAEVTTTAAAVQPVEVKLYIGTATYFINNSPQQMDVGPIILGGRTLLPARYIAEALGAEVQWDAAEKKVVITRGSTVIEMWVDQAAARVNGVEQYIDPDNTQVSPIIIPPGRTMTPGRFIAENLGATVAWDPVTKEVKITYQPPAGPTS